MFCSFVVETRVQKLTTKLHENKDKDNLLLLSGKKFGCVANVEQLLSVKLNLRQQSLSWAMKQLGDCSACLFGLASDYHCSRSSHYYHYYYYAIAVFWFKNSQGSATNI